MCGIAGVVSAARVNSEAVRRMNQIQAHRGPDGEGLFLSDDGRVCLGHRRLSILDLSQEGAQPMRDPRTEVVLTFNGEIYNFIEIRERLRGLGHSFHSSSDTEVLLRAYLEWGEDCLSELNGMFAFALWDPRSSTLFCARDRFGEKPFQYVLTPRLFAFASEVKALALLEETDLGIHDGVLRNYALHDSTWLDSSEATLLRGVRQLLPAHAMSVKIDERGVTVLRLWNYWAFDWRVRGEYGTRSLSSAADELLHLLRESIRLRLRSDVRVGSCLSGGLDSSTIVGLMRELEPGAELRTFTGRFPGEARDEGHYANMVVERCGTVHREVAPTPQSFLEDVESLYRHADFPVGGMSQYAQYCVFRLAKQNETVVLLDGQGSDEQLAGYGNAISLSFVRDLFRARKFLAFDHERRAALGESPHLFSAKRMLVNETPLRATLPFLRKVTRRSTLTRASLFEKHWLDDSKFWEVPDSLRGDDTESFSSTLYRLSFRTMLSSLLRFGDRLSMAHSREVRLPFCDHRIAEFTFGLPADLLVGEGQVKRVLRAAIPSVVPSEIVTRPKQGFIPPQEKWLTGPLAEWVRDLVNNPSEELASRLDLRVLQSIANGDEAKRTREIGWIWDTANILAWGRYSHASMRSRERISALA